MLILYGLLPIVRTTIAGLRGIDPVIREAGIAMGMTDRELLRLVELPLALPSIIAGVRVAAVVGVGSATIAAAIGAGGLGEFIYRGLSMVDTTVILGGAIPAAGLALAVDALLYGFERSLSRRRGRRPRATPVAAARRDRRRSGGERHRGPAHDRGDRVGSKNFTEQLVLGELLAQTIERHTGLRVDRRLNLGGTLICDRALLTGDIDAYVEYTGTALTAVFHEPVASDPAQRLRDRPRAIQPYRAHAPGAARLQQHVRDSRPRSRRPRTASEDDRRRDYAGAVLARRIRLRVSRAA